MVTVYGYVCLVPDCYRFIINSPNEQSVKMKFGKDGLPPTYVIKMPKRGVQTFRGNIHLSKPSSKLPKSVPVIQVA